MAILPLATPGGEPAWDVARLFPNQGHWSETEYLALKGNHLVEFSDGCVEVLPMPTMTHQLIVLWLYGKLHEFVSPQALGRSLVAPFRIRLWDGKYREPDICFMLAGHSARLHELFWDAADLVMEVVSDDDRSRDLEVKRIECAQAGIPEYWIVDPQNSTISLLRLEQGAYAVQGQYGFGTEVHSIVLPGFAIDVRACFTL